MMGHITETPTILANPDFVFDVLEFLDLNDLYDRVTWRADRTTGQVRWFVICNDLFFWGASDCQELTPDNFHVLKQAIADCEAVISDFGDYVYGTDLFCARIRGERPQAAAYPEEREFWPLFDACGPERPTGFGNPFQPGNFWRRLWHNWT